MRAALFAEHLWHAPDYSSELLFSRGLGFISLSEANGEDTDFSWIPQVWQTFPQHRVVLLTDGNGYPPKAILPSGRKRTSAVLLQVRTNLPINVGQIEATVQSFASSFVHVDSLRDLAAAWAMLSHQHHTPNFGSGKSGTSFPPAESCCSADKDNTPPAGRRDEFHF